MTHILQRRDTASNWTLHDPVLMLGEVGWESDTRRAKLGDGVTPWTGLQYVLGGGGGGAVDENSIRKSFSFPAPSVRWECTHSLGKNQVHVSCYGSDGKEMIGDVQIVDSNKVEIHWYVPVAGTVTVTI